jgi:hypothetical protein
MTIRQSRLLIALLAAILWAMPAAQQKGQDAFLSGPPFSLNDILQRVGIIADRRLRLAIDRRGLSFSPSPEDLDRLKQAGAGSELLQIIQAKAPPPAKPKPAPPAHAGLLTLHCAPAECEILINGKLRGATSHGSMEIHNLPVGNAVIDLRKEGFEGQQVVIPMHAGASADREVTLQPTVATRNRVGNGLVGKMIERLGGKDAFQKSSLVSAAGSASLLQAGGQKSDWQATARLRLPATALIELIGPKTKWWTSLSGDDIKSGGTRQMAHGPLAGAMEKMVRLYRDYQLAAVVGRLAGLKATAMDAAPNGSGEQRVRVFNRDAAFHILLDSEGSPVHLFYEPPAGQGSAVEVTYDDYASVQNVWYPRSMSIKLTEQQPLGLELHWKDVAFPDKLIDKEFHR